MPGSFLILLHCLGSSKDDQQGAARVTNDEDGVRRFRAIDSEKNYYGFRIVSFCPLSRIVSFELLLSFGCVFFWSLSRMVHSEFG